MRTLHTRTTLVRTLYTCSSCVTHVFLLKESVIVASPLLLAVLESFLLLNSLDLPFDRPDVRSRHFFPIGAVRDSAVPVTVGASGKGLWCSVWLKHDQLSPLCWPRPTQSRP